MLVTLDIQKHQLRAIQELASLLEIKIHIEPELSEEQENHALYMAMQDGDQSILNEKELQDFNAWLND
ncbi:MAG: hypothetical protein K9H64_10235 [Bacteroidales bacterium]|nr:hypothetical protein [Bacteroidales bacterium]MCF8456246.1 hypothetical protein [Bacteroidales bacterium]